jgi:hypothetical protein
MPLRGLSTTARPRSGSGRPEAALQPLLRAYGPWGASARVSYPYSRLVTDGLWQLPDPAGLFDAGGNIWEGMARQRDARAGFAPDVLATFECEPELIDVGAVHLLDRHFASGLHEEILEAVGLELGTPVHPPARRGVPGRGARGVPSRVLRLRLLLALGGRPDRGRCRSHSVAFPRRP